MVLEKNSYSMKILKNGKVKPVEVSIIEEPYSKNLRQLIIKYKGGLFSLKEKEIVILQRYLLKSVLTDSTLSVSYNTLESDKPKTINLMSDDAHLLEVLDTQINTTVEVRRLDERRDQLRDRTALRELLENTAATVALDKRYKQLMSKHKTSKRGGKRGKSRTRKYYKNKNSKKYKKDKSKKRVRV
jgi:hypothetical protein